MENILQVNNLNVFYGNVHVLRNVKLEVKEREIVTLIGSNGAGKTTLMMTISGVLKPKSGSIKFYDKLIHKMKVHQIISLGVAQVPQEKHIFPDMTVKENLEIGAYRFRNSYKHLKYDQVYHYFPRLSERTNQKAGLLSGGEQQMLAFGRALMSNCKILLLDEPSAGLAPIIIKEISEIILQLRKNENITALIVEQNAQLALDIADRGYVLANGSVVKKGKSYELKESDIVKKAYLGI